MLEHRSFSRRGVIAMLAGVACCPGGPRAAGTPPKEARERHAGIAPAAHTVLTDLAAKDRFSGTVLLDRGTSAPFRAAFGMADRAAGITNQVNTRFNIGSMNKMFTAVAIGQLVERGLLSYEDAAIRHLPSLAAILDSRILVSHLLSHTSGLGNFWDSARFVEQQERIASIADYMAVIDLQPLQFDPGARFAYSNTGYILLGAIIESASGESYYDYVERRVFTPAGMSSSAFPLHGDRGVGHARMYDNGCFARPGCSSSTWVDVSGRHRFRGGPAGGGYSTVDDLLRFGQGLRNGRLVSGATLTALTTQRSEAGPMSYGYGFGLGADGPRRRFGHNGGAPGVGAQLDIFVDPPATLVVLTNMSGALRAVLPHLRRLLSSPPDQML